MRRGRSWALVATLTVAACGAKSGSPRTDGGLPGADVAPPAVDCAGSCARIKQLCPDVTAIDDIWLDACRTECGDRLQLLPELARLETTCVSAASTCDDAITCAASPTAPSDGGAGGAVGTSAADASGGASGGNGADAARDAPFDAGAPMGDASRDADASTDGPVFRSVAPCTSASMYVTYGYEANPDGVEVRFGSFVEQNGDNPQTYIPQCLAVPAGSTVIFKGEFHLYPLAPSQLRGDIANNPITRTTADAGTSIGTASFVFPTPGFFAYYSDNGDPRNDMAVSSTAGAIIWKLFGVIWVR